MRSVYFFASVVLAVAFEAALADERTRMGPANLFPGVGIEDQTVGVVANHQVFLGQATETALVKQDTALANQCGLLPQAKSTTGTNAYSVSLPTKMNGELELRYSLNDGGVVLYRDHGRYIAGRAQLDAVQRKKSYDAGKMTSWDFYSNIFREHFEGRTEQAHTLEIGLGMGSGVFRLVDAGAQAAHIEVVDHDPTTFLMATKCLGVPLQEQNFHTGDASVLLPQLAQQQKVYDFVTFDAFEAECLISNSVKDNINDFTDSLVQVTAFGGALVFNTCNKGDQWQMAEVLNAKFKEQYGVDCKKRDGLSDENVLQICLPPKQRLRRQAQQSFSNLSPLL